MNTQEATAFGQQIAGLVSAGNPDAAYQQLLPLLNTRTPFPMTGRIGSIVGREPLEAVNVFLDIIARGRTEGGWVVIGCALEQQLSRDPSGSFARCRRYIIDSDVWYGPDILGERLPGPALVADFPEALEMLAPWRQDESRWVRRTVGVSVHYWARKSSGRAELTDRARSLLDFLEPMIEERDTDAVKGVGWGLKTLGRYYPDLLVGWLSEHLPRHRGRFRSLMLKKALTYLSSDHRALVTGVMS